MPHSERFMIDVPAHVTFLSFYIQFAADAKKFRAVFYNSEYSSII